jgi:hypothetical protein
MKTVAKSMNFKLQIGSPTDGGMWGQELANGTFTASKKKRCWLGRYLSTARTILQIVDFTFPSQFDKVCFMV